MSETIQTRLDGGRGELIFPPSHGQQLPLFQGQGGGSLALPNGETVQIRAGAQTTMRLRDAAEDAARQRVLRDVQALSSGTIATLTGLKRYDESDRVHAAFTMFVFDSPQAFAHWQEAWESFRETEACAAAVPLISPDGEARLP